VIPVVAHRHGDAAVSSSQVALSPVNTVIRNAAGATAVAQRRKRRREYLGAGPARPRSATARMRTLACRVDATTMAHGIDSCQQSARSETLSN
jgi:hypothetical protein